MKKHLFFALAAFGMVACMQDEIVTVQQDAISFQGAFVENATRAAEDPSTNTQSIADFNVWGFMDQPSGYVFTGDKVAKAGDVWTYVNTQYWAPGHTYYFAAVSPAENKHWTLVTTGANTYGPGVLSFENVDGSEDLLYAATSVETPRVDDLKAHGMDAVKLNFSHLLSKVKFTFKNGFATDNMSLVVENIEMTAPATGTIDLAVENWWDNNDWTPAEEDELHLQFGNVALLTAGKSDECAQERLTIPVDKNYKYYVTFTVALYTGNYDKPALTTTKTTEISGVALEMGKAYNFSAEINPENLNLPSIEFEVAEVKNWVTSGEPSNDVQVREAELKAALLLGQTYTLPYDVEVSSPVVVPAGMKAVLNLNGKTLKNNVNNQNTDVIVVEEGGELVINGEGTVEAVTGNDGYAVIAKGKVTINGGTYKAGVDENGEANAVVYARGNGEVYVNGGYFPNEHNSVYVLNKRDADRATTVIEVRGGTYGKFDPANNAAENAGTNFLADGYSSYKSGNEYVVIAGSIATAGHDTELDEVLANPEIGAVLFTDKIENVGEGYEVNSDMIFLMDNKELNAGSNANSYWYAIQVSGEHNVVINDANLTRAGIYADGGADVVFNSGVINHNPERTSRYIFCARNEGTTITINNGTFKNDRAKNSYFWADGAVIYVKGGNFGGVASNNKVVLSNGGQVIISGGTFNFDPTTWVAAGYKAVKSGSTWTVVAE